MSTIVKIEIRSDLRPYPTMLADLQTVLRGWATVVSITEKRDR